MSGHKLLGLWAGALCLLISCSMRAQADVMMQTDTQLQLDKQTSVAFEYFNRHIFVNLTVNGNPGFTFLFDTGTSTNILNLQTSQRLGLNPESIRKEKDLGLGDGKVATAAAKNVDVEMGNVRVANALDVVDLHGLEQVNGHRMDGILGFPLLEHFVVELDFQNQILTLQPVKHYKYHGRGEILILSHKAYPAAVPVVLGTFSDSQHNASVEIDTGSDATLLLYSKFAQQAHLVEDPRQLHNQEIYGIGGAFPVQFATLRYMALGSTAVSPLTVLFMKTTPHVTCKRNLGGIVGTAVLAKYQRVIFDIPGNRFILEHAPLATSQITVPRPLN